MQTALKKTRSKVIANVAITKDSESTARPTKSAEQNHEGLMSIKIGIKLINKGEKAQKSVTAK